MALGSRGGRADISVQACIGGVPAGEFLRGIRPLEGGRTHVFWAPGHVGGGIAATGVQIFIGEVPAVRPAGNFFEGSGP